MPVRSSHISTGVAGILGVVPTDEEIVAVYPALSATINPHAQKLRFRRGDSLDLPVQVQDDQDPPSNVMLHNSVLRFAVRQGFGASPRQFAERNDEALVIKRSYDPTEIEFTDRTNGRAIVHVPRSDTIGLPLVPTIWDLELAKATEEITVPGANAACFPPTVPASVMAGSPYVTVQNVDLRDLGLQLGDIIHVQTQFVLIDSVLSAQQLKTDFTGWTTEADLQFALYRGRTKTIALGPFEILGDVVI